MVRKGCVHRHTRTQVQQDTSPRRRDPQSRNKGLGARNTFKHPQASSQALQLRSFLSQHENILLCFS